MPLSEHPRREAQSVHRGVKSSARAQDCAVEGRSRTEWPGRQLRVGGPLWEPGRAATATRARTGAATAGPLLKWRCSQRRRRHRPRESDPGPEPPSSMVIILVPQWQPPCRAARRDSGLTFRFRFKGPVVLHFDSDSESCRAGARRCTRCSHVCLACEGAFVILGSQSRNLGRKSRNLGRVGSTGDARAKPRSITH